MINDKEYSIYCTGDVCVGDEIIFKENVFKSNFRNPKFLGERKNAVRILKDSYGGLKQQHTFTIEIIDSEGVEPLEKGIKTRRKGRNIYRFYTMRKPWKNEKERKLRLREKHSRGEKARKAREYRRDKEIYGI